MENNGNRQINILSEVDLLELLNVEKVTLDRLRQKEGFPYVRLNKNNRVYLLENIVEWLSERLIEA